jgi:hypothetical protein
MRAAPAARLVEITAVRALTAIAPATTFRAERCEPGLGTSSVERSGVIGASHPPLNQGGAPPGRHDDNRGACTIAIVEPERHPLAVADTAAKATKKTRGLAAQLSDGEFLRLVSLIKDADSVELKLTVPESDQRSAVDALGMDPLRGQLRQVFFFDTPDLALNREGVVARARRVQKKGDDSVVKLRPVVPSELPGSVRKSPNLMVEVDAMPSGFVCSASLKRALGNVPVRDTCAGKRPLRDLFSKEQRAFFKKHAPEGLELNDLAVLGPINVLKLKFSPAGFDRRLVAELWLYPDNARILELSTKCKPSEAFQVAAEVRAFLLDREVNLSGEQQTKTRTALEFFSKQR